MGKPAARQGDMHLCPAFDGSKPHVGGPISGNVSGNVFVNGRPVALVGSTCTCISPTMDGIKEGSNTVFVNGVAVARMGDMTNHGGSIATGSATVFIGDRSDARLRKAATYKERRETVAAGRAAADREADPEKSAALRTAADRLELYGRALERAELADHIYTVPFGNDKKGVTPPPDGWVMLEARKDPTTGFAYAVYQSEFEEPPVPVVAFRGTDNADELKRDWWANFKNAKGDVSKQHEATAELVKSYNSAEGDFDAGALHKSNRGVTLSETNLIAYYEASLSDRYPQGVEFTGHSKGGGQAEFAAVISGQPGYAFNPAGISERAYQQFGKTKADAASVGVNGLPLVETFSYEHDPLRSFQDNPKIFKHLATPAGGRRHNFAGVDSTGKKLPFWSRPNRIAGYHGIKPFLADGMQKAMEEDTSFIKSFNPPILSK